MAEKKVFQYVQIKSFVYPDFWYKLAELKLDVEKLDEKDRTIFGSYSNFNVKNCLLELDTTSFNSDFNSSKSFFPSHGILKNLNTIEAFKNCNKEEILRAEGEKLIERIENGACLNDPSLLSSFVLLTFSDLKKYNFYYWCGFPALIELVINEEKPSKTINEEFSPEIIEKFTQNYQNLENRQATFFAATDESLDIKLLKDVLIPEQDLTSLLFCFSDPSEFDDPGWILRNFLLLLLKLAPSLRGKVVKILAIRQDATRALTPSRLFYVNLPTDFNFESPKWTGWERNSDGKLMPKGVSMGKSMDPMEVAKHFSTLNLKLMKWRLLPSLNLDIIYKQKCLLFGAGTLGCSIARSLVAWGITNISFVDCGHVAFSNPVRQSLFVNADAVQNKFKAIAAAERLKEILPSVQAAGHVLQIPMPGHAIGGGDSAREKVLESIHKIVDLIKSHDILFLITDSRESRWLCTMLGAFYGKTVITSALGFESYLVMRHGVRNDEVEEKDIEVEGLKCISGSNLGCYFCNDVTAPGNSTRDRTLDQQCTVTRPGASNIAASTAVELVVSLLQHEKKAKAPAYYQMKRRQNEDATIPEGILGILPHSIRGYLGTYSIILPATERFNQCIACSEKVLNEYEAHGDEFLLKVFDSADYLEAVTGIAKTMTEYNDDDINDDFDADIMDESD